MSKQRGKLFHHRFYRYVRMMLRRYPKMQNEALAVTWTVTALVKANKIVKGMD